MVMLDPFKFGIKSELRNTSFPCYLCLLSTANTVVVHQKDDNLNKDRIK